MQSYSKMTANKMQIKSVLFCLLSWFYIISFMVVRIESQAMESIYFVSLYGSNELQEPGDPNGRGLAKLSFNTVRGSLLFDIRVSDVDQPIAANILFGSSEDYSGTGQFNFDGLGDFSGTIVSLLSETTHIEKNKFGAYRFYGAVAVPVPTMTQIVTNPTNYYLQIYTTKFLYGALRGQLVDATKSIQGSVSDSNTDNWNANSALP